MNAIFVSTSGISSDLDLDTSDRDAVNAVIGGYAEPYNISGTDCDMFMVCEKSDTDALNIVASIVIGAAIFGNVVIAGQNGTIPESVRMNVEQIIWDINE